MENQVVTYKIGDSLYINVTNQCTNHCVFCIRQTEEGVGYNLWLQNEPTIDEIIRQIPKPEAYEEIVFCGYGEPLMRADLVLDAARILKEKGARIIRINTNGQSNLFYNHSIVPKMKGIVDIVSISLNAENSFKYIKLCDPNYGVKAYPAILQFTEECIKTVGKVILTVVDWPGVDVEACKKVADNFKVEFRIRSFTGNN